MEAIFTPSSNVQAAPVSKKRHRIGLALSGVAILFLAFDSILKLLQLPVVLEGTAQLGYPTSVVFGIGLLLAVCLAFYVIPRTSILGAILLTGYLGGAIATHVRVGNPLFSHTLFPIYVALLIWGGLYLREERLRALVPLIGGTSRP